MRSLSEHWNSAGLKVKVRRAFLLLSYRKIQCQTEVNRLADCTFLFSHSVTQTVERLQRVGISHFTAKVQKSQSLLSATLL